MSPLDDWEYSTPVDMVVAALRIDFHRKTSQLEMDFSTAYSLSIRETDQDGFNLLRFSLYVMDQ
jgi:hypothetical protein